MAGIIENRWEEPHKWNLRINGYNLFWKDQEEKRERSAEIYSENDIVCFQDTDGSEANDFACNGSVFLTHKNQNGIVAAVCKSPNHRRE